MYDSDGRVTIGRRTTHTVNITTPVLPSNEVLNDDEIHLIVNGVVIKRLSKYAAERLGIVSQ